MESINDAIILEETALLEQDEDANDETTTTYVIIYEGFPPEETPQIESAQPEEEETAEASTSRKRGRPKRGVDPLAIAESSVHNHESNPEHNLPPNKKSRNRQTKSYIWKYFTKLGSTKSRCNIEGCQKKTFSSSITSLKYHLRKIHGIIDSEDAAVVSPAKAKESPKSNTVTRKTRGRTEGVRATRSSIAKKKAPKAFSIWKHFSKLRGNKCKCTVKGCREKFDIKSTAILRKHLEEKHEIISPKGPRSKKQPEIVEEEEPDSPRPVVRTGRRNTSFVWKYFTKVTPSKCICNVDECNKRFLSCSTSTLMYHLKNRHYIHEGPNGEEVRKQPEKPKQMDGPLELVDIEELIDPAERAALEATIQVTDVEGESSQEEVVLTQIIVLEEPAATAEAVDPLAKKVKEASSYVWNYFIKSGLTQCICQVDGCGVGFASKSTTSLKYHLKHRHGIDSANQTSTPVSFKPATKKPRCTTSYVWKYFFKCSLTDCKCRVRGCGAMFKSKMTSSLKSHLKREHGVSDPKEVAEAEATEQENDSMALLSSVGLQPVANGVRNNPRDPGERSTEITKLIAKMIAVDLRAPSIVDGIGFQELIHYFDPTYTLPHRSAFSGTQAEWMNWQEDVNVLQEVADEDNSFFKEDGPKSARKKRGERDETSKMIAKMIAVDLAPVKIVGGRGFRELVKFFRPSFVIPHPTTFTRTHLPELMGNIKGVVLKDMQQARHITVTTEYWQNDYAHNHSVNITTHFITDSWDLKSYFLASVLMEGNVTGELIAKSICETLQEFGAVDSTLSIVTDHGTNVRKVGEIGDNHQMDCFADRLDMCLTTYGLDAVPEWSGLLQRCKDIVQCLRKVKPAISEEHQDFQNFMECVVNNDHHYGNVTADIGTTSLKKHRWSSICIMVGLILKVQPDINTILVMESQVDLILRKTEIKGLEKLLDFLAPFKKLAETFQTEKWPTLSRIWPAICFLKMKCQPGVPEDPSVDDQDNYDASVDGFSYVNYAQEIETLKGEVLQALIDAFPEDQISTLATSMDLRFRGFKGSFKTPGDYNEAIKHFLITIQDNLEDYSIPTEAPAAEVSKFTRDWGELFNAEDEQDSELMIEIRKYLSLKPLSEKEKDNFELLLWWRDHKKEFPLLSKVARKIHAVVATSTSSEWMYSTCACIANQKRTRLLSQHVNMFLFIHNNYHCTLGS